MNVTAIIILSIPNNRKSHLPCMYYYYSPFRRARAQNHQGVFSSSFLRNVYDYNDYHKYDNYTQYQPIHSTLRPPGHDRYCLRQTHFLAVKWIIDCHHGSLLSFQWNLEMFKSDIFLIIAFKISICLIVHHNYWSLCYYLQIQCNLLFHYLYGMEIYIFFLRLTS